MVACVRGVVVEEQWAEQWTLIEYRTVIAIVLFDKNRLRFPEVVDRVVGLGEQRLFYCIHDPGISRRSEGSEF